MTAVVEIEARPFRLSAAVRRDAIDELDLIAADAVIATVKANVAAKRVWV